MTFVARRTEDSKSAADVLRILQKSYEANEPVILTAQRQGLLLDHIRSLQSALMGIETDQFTSAIRSLVDEGTEGQDPAQVPSCTCGQSLVSAVEKLFKQCDGCYAYSKYATVMHPSVATTPKRPEPLYPWCHHAAHCVAAGYCTRIPNCGN